MNRRDVLVGTGAVAATALSGCLGSASENDDANAQADPETTVEEDGSDRTVVVSASGEVTGDPDLAVLDVGVEATADSAQEVRDELSRESEALIDALVGFGIDEDDITTSRYHIHEQIDRKRLEAAEEEPETREEAEEYIHYVGTHSLSVDVHDVDAVGDVIDVAVDAGADQVGHVTFTLSDEKRDELREEALRKAIGNAREEAEVIADEIGGSIVEATVVDASGGGVSPVRRHLNLAADEQATPTPEMAMTTSLEPGDVTVTAQVRVQYEVE